MDAQGHHRGTDRSGTVGVEIGAGSVDARLVLVAGWRRRVGLRDLGRAVVEAFDGALAGHLVAPAAAPAGAAPVPGGATDDAAVLDRAWREMREFRSRLAELVGDPVTVTDARGRVRAVVGGGRLAGVELDPRWAARATDAELAEHVEQALRSAAAAVAGLPVRALDGCPNLRAVLGRPTGAGR
jgi:hypothetical protein